VFLSIGLQVHDKFLFSVIELDALTPEEIRSTGDVLCVEWDSDPVVDMIADSILTLVLQMKSNPAVMNRLSASFIRAFLSWEGGFMIYFPLSFNYQFRQNFLQKFESLIKKT
jgi:hypothetical protein